MNHWQVQRRVSQSTVWDFKIEIHEIFTAPTSKFNFIVDFAFMDNNVCTDRTNIIRTTSNYKNMVYQNILNQRFHLQIESQEAHHKNSSLKKSEYFKRMVFESFYFSKTTVTQINKLLKCFNQILSTCDFYFWNNIFVKIFSTIFAKGLN